MFSRIVIIILLSKRGLIIVMIELTMDKHSPLDEGNIRTEDRAIM